MEFSNIVGSALGRFADQGFMFWTATGAVALGITLILTAGIVQLRRLHSRSVVPVTIGLEKKAEPVEIPEEVDLAMEKKEETRKTPVGLTPTSGEENPEELHLLLERLREAVDRLEAYPRFKGEMLAKTSESLLKETREGVDYLFRTGTG